MNLRDSKLASVDHWNPISDLHRLPYLLFSVVSEGVIDYNPVRLILDAFTRG
jgi:hypothetical protein